MSKIESKREGFTLLELLIVILLISIFTFLAFAVLKKSDSSKSEQFDLMHLRKPPVDIPSSGAELVCINECKECYFVYPNMDSNSKIESSFGKIKAYLIDNENSLQEIDFGRIDDNRVCLRFHYYGNGSNSEMIIESKGKFYYYPTYFGKTEIFDNISDAKERWKNNRYRLRDKGDYY